MTLDELKPGFHGRVCAVNGRGALRRRLLEMGLTPGTKIYVEKTAPMGDPMEIRLRGYHLTLRKDGAAEIEVEALPNDGEGA